MPISLCQPARAWQAGQPLVGLLAATDAPGVFCRPVSVPRGSQHTPRRDTTRPNGIDETIQQRATALIKAAMHGQPPEVKLLLKSFQHYFGANKGQPLDVDGHSPFPIFHAAICFGLLYVQSQNGPVG